MAVPKLPGGGEAEVLERLAAAGITGRHDVVVVDAGETLDALSHFGLEPTTMGRSVADDPAYHLAAGAAGIVASECTGS